MQRAAHVSAALTNYVLKAWLVSTFLVGLAFCFLMPPFQTNDETHHWDRLYTVMQLQRHCSSVPDGVDQVVAANAFEQIKGGWKWEFRRLDSAMTAVAGEPQKLGYSHACSYPAIAYAIPAALARIGQWIWPVSWGRLFLAFYLARVGNWLSLTLCVWLAMRTLPRLRAFALAVYSVPMVIHQSASINQDAAIVGLHLLLLIVLLRFRPVWKLVGIAVLSWLLYESKIVFLPLFSLLAIPLWELAGRLGDKRRRLLFLLALVPPAVGLLTSPWWIAHVLRSSLGGEPGVFWAKPAQQTELIISQPSLLFEALRHQLSDNLGHGHLTGGYTSIIGVLGWAQHEIPEHAINSVLWALPLAMLADMLTVGAPQPGFGRVGGWLEWIWCRFVPALIPFSVVFLIDIGFFVVFTPPGSPFIIGVQGRYYFGPLILVGAALAWWGGNQIDWAAARWHRFALEVQTGRTILAGVLILFSFSAMIDAWQGSYAVISDVYYHHAKW